MAAGRCNNYVIDLCLAIANFDLQQERSLNSSSQMHEIAPLCLKILFLKMISYSLSIHFQTFDCCIFPINYVACRNNLLLNIDPISRSYLQETKPNFSINIQASRHLIVVLRGLHEASVRNYHYALRNDREERRFH